MTTPIFRWLDLCTYYHLDCVHLNLLANSKFAYRSYTPLPPTHHTNVKSDVEFAAGSIAFVVVVFVVYKIANRYVKTPDIGWSDHNVGGGDGAG
jgi:hypothetical protein